MVELHYKKNVINKKAPEECSVCREYTFKVLSSGGATCSKEFTASTLITKLYNKAHKKRLWKKSTASFC